MTLAPVTAPDTAIPAIPIAGPVAGIDVSSRFLDTCILPARQHLRCPNTPEAFPGLLQQLRQAGVTRVVLEATGGYEYRAACAIAQAGLAVHRVNPDRIWGWRRSLGRLAKTDKLDAALIAGFAQTMTLPERPLPGPQAQAIKSLAARSRQLVEMIAAEKTRLKQSFDPMQLESLRLVLAALGAERDRIEAALQAAIAADPASRRRETVLRSIPGIGPKIAAMLVAEMPELGKLDRHAVASLAGVAPHPQQSGQMRSRDQLRGGRPCVRVALYMAALSTTRANSPFAAEYKALVARGKPRKVALIAMARKLITLANQLVRDDRLWSKTKPAA